MEKIKNFVFNDVVLYAKYWYEHTNIIDDLGYIFGEIYGLPSDMTEAEVAEISLRVLDKLCEEYHARGIHNKWYMSFYQFENKVSNNKGLYECSRELAVIRTVLSILCDMELTDIELNKPVFGKDKHFRLGNMFIKYPKSMTYTNMNKHAEKFFGGLHI